jgi:prepilin-type N-terminal cleavage/methylation domain-containing protein
MNNKGFTLIELMIVIAIIGILSAIAIPNFIAYRNKSYCSSVESDANQLVTSISDYFAVPTRETIAQGDQSYVPPSNGYTLVANNTSITITVTDSSGRCPAEYTSASPVNANGEGWLNGSTYQKVFRIN